MWDFPLSIHFQALGWNPKAVVDVVDQKEDEQAVFGGVRWGEIKRLSRDTEGFRNFVNAQYANLAPLNAIRRFILINF